MIEYVAGFLHTDNEIVLIEKNRPEWQAGLLNGVGGKIEPEDSSPAYAMYREFHEEAGAHIPSTLWDHFLTLKGTESTIYCFACHVSKLALNLIQTREDEEIYIVGINDLLAGVHKTVPNVKWIVPLMLQRGNYKPVEVVFHESTRGTK